MNKETKTCQNCQKDFTIESEDFDFYEKIKMPPPTFCPECRLVRRMCFRNERALYKNKCELCGKPTLSIYNIDSPFHIYCHDCWWSDKWEASDYGVEYDFNEPFFGKFGKLSDIVPKLALSGANMVKCDYCNFSTNERECYLNSASEGNERVMFGNRVIYNKDSFDLYIGDRCELCYELVNCLKCYKLFFGRNCIQCSDSAFLVDCSNCMNCFGCINLRNKQYCIFNEQYTKEQYQSKLQELKNNSFEVFKKIKKQYSEFVLQHPRRFATIIKSIQATGDNIRYAKNCHFCFDVVGNPSAEDTKFAIWAGENLKDSYDVGPGVGIGVERCYEIFDCTQNSRLLSCHTVYNSVDAFYCINCHASSHLFACIGLRNKQHCILNKQYTKEEYEALVPKIISHMNDMPYTDKKGRVYKYGEFFPTELSPFAYNETIAQEYFPLTKQQAQEQGYLWKDPEPRNYQITIKSQDLPDNIKDVEDSILKEIIGCAHQGRCNEQCTEAFRIIPQELAFYRRMNLPLPRLCPNCRHYQRLKQRNPLKLWKRQCQAPGCSNTFETSYAPDRPETIYCEQCYLREVV